MKLYHGSLFAAVCVFLFSFKKDLATDPGTNPAPINEPASFSINTRSGWRLVLVGRQGRGSLRKTIPTDVRPHGKLSQIEKPDPGVDKRA